MSVLYKALSRAAKARDSDGGQAAREVPTYLARRRGGGALRALIILLVLVAAAGGVYFLYGDVIADSVTEIVFGPPAPSAPRKIPTPKPQPSLAQNGTATATAPVAANPTTPAPPASPEPNAAPGAAPPVPNPNAAAEPPPPAAAPAPPPVAVASAAPGPAPASPPDASAPASSTAAAPTATAPGTPAPLVPAPQASAPPAPPAPNAAPAAGAPNKTASVSSEQDLPAILDRIRQQRAKAALQPSAVVDRSRPSAAAVDGVPGGSGGMVSVENTPDQQRDDSERAYEMLLHGQYEGALDLYESVLKTVPDSVAALLGKAIALHKLRRPADARTFYRRVLAIDPNNREALTNLLSIVATQAPAAALAELHDMQKANPAFSPIPAQIAQIEAQNGAFSDAIDAFNRAIQLSPDNALYRLNLAIIEDRAGLPNEAAASYQAALDRLGPESGEHLPLPIDAIRARLHYLQSR